MIRPIDFFSMDTIPDRFQSYFQADFVWKLLGKSLQEYIKNLGPWGIYGKVDPRACLMSEEIFIGKNTLVEPGAVIKGPVWIGENCTIRSHGYVREYSLIMDGAAVGHASETKGSILLPGAQAPHFNYVGDSILGAKVNLGAGTILSNLKNLNEEIILEIEGKSYATGLRKFGAILGDGCKTGCNSVLNPGCLLGKNSIVYPLCSVKKGYYSDHSILKLRQSQEMGRVRS